MGANGAVGAAWSPWLFSWCFPIPISVLVLLTAAAAPARQKPDKLIDIYRRKAKGEFQSSGRTAGFHQCFLELFKSFSDVLCQCLRIVNRTYNYLSWALI